MFFILDIICSARRRITTTNEGIKGCQRPSKNTANADKLQTNYSQNYRQTKNVVRLRFLHSKDVKAFICLQKKSTVSIEIPKKVFEGFDNIFHVYLMSRLQKNAKENFFSRWLFEGRLRQGKNVLPDGLNWLCYFAGSSKIHRENSISFIFLECPHQVDMKNVVKCWKDFLSYSTPLETYRGK